MEYKNEKLSARFVVPDKITVRDQLAYLSEVTAYSKEQDRISKLWAGARLLITEWECPGFDLGMDLDKVDDPNISNVILWAALEVKKHITALESIPKNS